jgi:hypothetical protein
MKYLLGFALLFLVACQPKTLEETSDLQYFPSDYSLVVKTNSETLALFLDSEVASSYPFVSIGPVKQLSELALSFLTTPRMVNLGLYEEGKGTLTFLALAEASVQKAASEQFIYEGVTVFKGFDKDNEGLFWATLGEKTIWSNSQLLLEEAIRGQGSFVTPERISRLYAKSLKENEIKLISQPEFLELLSSEPLNKSYAKHLFFDLSFENGQFFANGITEINDSKGLAQFKESSLIEPQVLKIAPRSTKSLKTTTKPQGLENPYLEGAEEFAQIHLENTSLLYLRTIASETVMKRLEENRISESEYLGNRILKIEPFEFNNRLSEFSFTQPFTHVAVFEDAFVFSDGEGDLRELLKFVSTGDVLSNSTLYQSAEPFLSSEISTLYLKESDGFIQIFQQVKEEDYFFTAAGSVQKVAVKKSANSTPILNFTLESEALTRPQFVKNHYTGNQEIVVQDSKNILYRFSNDGKLLWKKQLEAKINEGIHEVDVYRNRKLQLAFTTETAFHIIDRNGNNVDGFPKRFNDGNIGALAVFDYDNSRNYRFLFSQGRDLYMYNNRGEKVDGFTYKRAEAPVITTPKHFRINSKDYIVLGLQNGSLKILQRNGKDRLVINQKFDFSKNDIFNYRDQFAFTTTQGNLIQISTSGKVSSTNLSLTSAHEITGSSRSLVIIDGQMLQIREKRMSLDYGIYTNPQFFLVNDKIYISVLEASSKKLYLYDSNAKLIPGFPVLGASGIDLVDMDGDKKVELVTKDEGNFLTVYRLE